ncbi:unnamed protein product [Closterium sp. Naga37s-1]|nr:unnamed protein product [Closterium sp. Naga37s-1]
MPPPALASAATPAATGGNDGDDISSGHGDVDIADAADVDTEPLTPSRISLHPMVDFLRAADVSDDVIMKCEEVVRRQVVARVLLGERRAKEQLITRMKQLEVGFSYPFVPRRTRLPLPDKQNRPGSLAGGLWATLRECVGRDLSRVCLPVQLNEPIGLLHKCAEEMEYSWLLDRAAEYGRRGDQLMRALHVAAFAMSGYANTSARMHKPFNPLLGETYEANYPDKGFKLLAEKQADRCVCHPAPVLPATPRVLLVLSSTGGSEPPPNGGSALLGQRVAAVWRLDPQGALLGAVHAPGAVRCDLRAVISTPSPVLCH